MEKSYPAIFTKEKDGFSVIFPDFAGATQGDDLEESMSNAKEFLDSILAYYIDEELSTPEPTKIELLTGNSNQKFVSLIQGDPTPYIQKKTVRKNVTIPEWLVSRGEKDKLNFSQLLTDALFERYG